MDEKNAIKMSNQLGTSDREEDWKHWKEQMVEAMDDWTTPEEAITELGKLQWKPNEKYVDYAGRVTTLLYLSDRVVNNEVILTQLASGVSEEFKKVLTLADKASIKSFSKAAKNWEIT